MTLPGTRQSLCGTWSSSWPGKVHAVPGTTEVCDTSTWWGGLDAETEVKQQLRNGTQKMKSMGLFLQSKAELHNLKVVSSRNQRTMEKIKRIQETFFLL